MSAVWITLLAAAMAGGLVAAVKAGAVKPLVLVSAPTAYGG